MKEKDIQTSIMLALSEKGFTIFRNNCGIHKTEDGRFIKYGVANPGGSDLIGWRQITITPEMFGKKIAVFTAIEVKTQTGRATDDQIRFIDAVRRKGGIAGVCRSVEDALALLSAAE